MSLVTQLLLLCTTIGRAHAQDTTAAPAPVATPRSIVACARKIVDAAGFQSEPMVTPHKVAFRAYKFGFATTSSQEVDALGVAAAERGESLPPRLEIEAASYTARQGNPRVVLRSRPLSFELSQLQDSIRAQCSPRTP